MHGGAALVCAALARWKGESDMREEGKGDRRMQSVGGRGEGQEGDMLKDTYNCHDLSK